MTRDYLKSCAEAVQSVTFSSINFYGVRRVLDYGAEMGYQVEQRWRVDARRAERRLKYRTDDGREKSAQIALTRAAERQLAFFASHGVPVGEPGVEINNSECRRVRRDYHDLVRGCLSKPSMTGQR